ncbi:heavy metal-associated isoprenylated plant protein 26-like [Papaver somniferum]|nr:heavy metal-associated isoprenylated plant protein 26-like [Papaver somniferum]
MGILDHLSHRFDFSHESRKMKKLKELQTVEIKVKIDCEGCERKIRRSVEGMKGVSSIDIDPKQHKLTVIGYVEPRKVLSRVIRRTGKKAEIWPYVPYGEVDHPYAPGVYDKKAPPGYVRNIMMNNDSKASNLARASSTEVKYSTAFSDENPNACVVM